jgi:hypothetical protein
VVKVEAERKETSANEQPNPLNALSNDNSQEGDDSQDDDDSQGGGISEVVVEEKMQSVEPSEVRIGRKRRSEASQ